MLKRNLLLAACAVLLCAGVRAQGATDRKMRDAGLIDVLEVDSTLRVRLMYSTDDNFMGRDVYGDLERAYLLPHFAAKLAHAQRLLRELLRSVMRGAGLVPYRREWWHYEEPMPMPEVRKRFRLLDF